MFYFIDFKDQIIILKNMKHYNSFNQLAQDLVDSGLEISLDRMPFTYCYDIIRDKVTEKGAFDGLSRSDVAKLFQSIPDDEQDNVLLCGFFIYLMAYQSTYLMRAIALNGLIKQTFLEACTVDFDYYINYYFKN